MGMREIVCADRMAGEVKKLLPGLSDEQAAAVGVFIQGQVRAENRAFNAWMMLKILMRLHDAKDSKMVAASLALAVGIVPIFIKQRPCMTSKDAAAALGVTSRAFRKEVQKSAAALEMKKL